MKQMLYKRFLPLLVLFLLCSPRSNGQTSPGNFTSFSSFGNTVTVLADTVRLRFVFYAPDIVRVDFLPGPSTLLDSSLVIIRDPSMPVSVSVVESDSSLDISSIGLRIRCSKYPLRLSYRNSNGSTLLAEGLSGGFSFWGSIRSVAFTLDGDDHFYGTGERGTELDKRGQVFDSYNDTFFGYTGALPRMNINVPFAANPRGYALYFENTYRGTFDFGVSDPAAFSYTAWGGEVSMFVIVAPTIQKQLDRYTWLTGRQPLPPRWALGYIQSKYGYQNAGEAALIVQTMRQKQIPCDAIVLDLFWFGAMGDLSWNPASWPAPYQMMRDFQRSGIKTVVITEPYVTSPSPNFPEGIAGGYFAKDYTALTYRLKNWWSCNCDAALVDLTSPQSQAWWWAKHTGFLGSDSAGVAGLWTDLGEPEQHPADMIHAAGPAPKIHNIFNLLWAKTVFEGYVQARPGERIFNLTRSGYAGIQRYGALPWSGDVGNSYSSLAAQLPMMLNMGMSGLAYQHSDIGGFCCGTTPAELYIRWLQYGVFCPITRAHGWGRSTEPWGYGTEAESIARVLLRLRYQLLPYNYTMASRAWQTGLPLARPIFFEEAGNPAVMNTGDEYFWGDNFVVAPVVVEGQTMKNVYLPAGGEWIDYWSEQRYAGGQTVTVSTPLASVPLFVRAGSIIPMQTVMNYSDEKPLDTLLLAVYPLTGGQGAFTLYEDDGRTTGYQSGAFSMTVFSNTHSGSKSSPSLTVTIGATAGSYAGQPQGRTYIAIIHGIAGRPSTVLKNGSVLPEQATYAALRLSGEGYAYDPNLHQLFLGIRTSPDSSYTIEAGNVQLGDVDPKGPAPGEFRLEQNYPNPFNPTTVVSWQLPVVSNVKLAIYDVLGREVATLVNGEKGPGRYTVTWDAAGFASGVYLCRLTAGSRASTIKMMVIR